MTFKVNEKLGSAVVSHNGEEFLTLKLKGGVPVVETPRIEAGSILTSVLDGVDFEEFINKTGDGTITGNLNIIGSLSTDGISSEGDVNVTGDVNVNGQVVATGEVIAFSDIRLKEDLKVIENSLDKLNSLSGYTYKRKDTGLTNSGLIAQEVKEVLPEAVSLQEEYYAVSYNGVIPLLVNAIKELTEIVEELKSNG